MAPSISKEIELSSKELFESQTHILSLALSYIKSISIKFAIELGIFEAINRHGKPLTLIELVATLPIKPEKSHRIKCLVQILVRSFLLAIAQEEDKEEEDLGYMLTPTARLLLQNETCNISKMVMLFASPEFGKASYSLGDWFSNDDFSPFDTAFGRSLWDYAGSEPSFGSLFNEAMAGDSSLFTNVLVEECKELFEGLTSIVDVGGGTGIVAKAIANTFPNMKCTVLELPAVVANLSGSENLEFVGGDMFQHIPSANAILLKLILHDWNDEDCVKILKKCKEAIPSKDEGGKIIIIDSILDSSSKSKGNEIADAQYLYDMFMMVVVAGKERTQKEWGELFYDAGFSNYKIIREFGVKSLIEVYP